MKRITKIIAGIPVLLGVLMTGGCGNLLSQPPSTLSRAISSGPTVSAAQTSVSMVWTTNAPARHILEYGTVSGSYPQTTAASAAADTSHSETLTGLRAGTAYYYRIKHFWDTGAYSVSGEYTAATTAEPTPTLAQKIRGIWMVGGLSGATVATTVNQIDLYDPVLGAWYPSITSFTAGSMTPVSFDGAVGYTRPADGHHLIVVIGGFDSSGVVRNLVQTYDVEGNSWSSGTPMTTPQANINAVGVYDKVYIMGGTTGNAAGAWAGSTTNYQYAVGSTWSTMTAYAAAANSERFTYAYNDTVYNLAGRSGPAAVAASAHDGYSIAANALTTGTTETVMVTPRTGVAGALWVPRSPLTGAAKILLVGGFSSLTGTTSNCIVTLGTTANTATTLFQYLNYPFAAPSAWTAPTNQYPLAIGFGAAGVYRNTLYHFGGTATVVASPTPLASGTVAAYSFDLSNFTNSWTAIANMPVGRYGHSAVTFPQ
jgi:hypothetical protein